MTTVLILAFILITAIGVPLFLLFGAASMVLFASQDGGTITSPLVPWNTCGAFMSSTLGVATFAYLPYCLLNLVNPIIGMLLGYTGWTITRIRDDSATQT